MREVEVAPEVRELCARLLPEVEPLAHRMADRIRAEVPFYGEETVVPRGELDGFCVANMRYVLGNMAGVPLADRGPRVTGTSSTGEAVPYAIVLQAFRVGARFIWEALVELADPDARDVLLLAAADVWAISDAVAADVTRAYRGALEERVRRNEQMRSVMVGGLLEGDDTVAGDTGEVSSVLGLGRTGEFVVVSAESPAPGKEGLRGVERALRRSNVRSAWRLDHDRQEGVVALRFGFGVDQLTAALQELATGRVGISRPFARLEEARDGRREAQVASAGASPGATAVVRFGDDPLAVLLASSPDHARAMVDAVLAPVLALPPDDRAVYLDTARAWLEAAGSTAAAADALVVHRNTVRYRIRRLEEMTGRDLTRPVDGAALYVALECVRILGLD
ncbi:PucR family transcriptional regulator [Nocardioides sp. GY 10113]|uniref:PucR family transcriptional regulator n=1 Tax=Nocardioides sp. GY 10113 TaxID=2569761 RepID=UPI0010A80DA7|nr:PucR family transcriptional regulator [Nocardioides sp. GY 10113]TIC83588.1 PucR family transcriptional regulator [Nocardioides sp. GY 10113]